MRRILPMSSSSGWRGTPPARRHSVWILVNSSAHSRGSSDDSKSSSCRTLSAGSESVTKVGQPAAAAWSRAWRWKRERSAKRMASACWRTEMICSGTKFDSWPR